MNRHFTDAAYYARRTAEATYTGLREELQPAIQRVREYRGDEPDDPQTRIEELQAELDALETRAEAEARDAIQHARGRLESLRSAQ